MAFFLFSIELFGLGSLLFLSIEFSYSNVKIELLIKLTLNYLCIGIVGHWPFGGWMKV
jgi:hypothetical protein